jgi:1,4-alpha-glucan branching enzyme
MVVLVEIMPIKEYPGEIGWGYTPRYHFAIQSTYGTTAELKEMVDTFHKHGIRVIMDGVYNHVSGERLSKKSSLTKQLFEWINLRIIYDKR